RLATDCAHTNRKKYGKRALTKTSVLSTWNGILERDSSLPAVWTGENRVLVG
ncbi:hypothetical protein C8J56DRAFT_718286, partial [Mycena floridula]